VRPSVGLSVSMVPPDLRSRKPHLPSPPIEKETVSGRAPRRSFSLASLISPTRFCFTSLTPHITSARSFLHLAPRARFESWGTRSRTTDVSSRLRMGFSRASYLHASHLHPRSARYLSHRSLPSLVLHHLFPTEGCSVHLCLRYRSRTVDLVCLKWMCKVKVEWNP
jgi:hypothetical protein